MQGVRRRHCSLASRAGGVLTARALRSSLRGGAEGGEECSCGSALEDRNIDRCGSKGSQLAWMRQLRRIDRSGYSVEIAGN